MSRVHDVSHTLKQMVIKNANQTFEMTDVKIMKQESENFDIEFPSDTAVPKRVKLFFRSTSHHISV